MPATRKRSERAPQSAQTKRIRRARSTPNAKRQSPESWPLYQLLPPESPAFLRDSEAIPFESRVLTDPAWREFDVWRTWYHQILKDPTHQTAPLWGVIAPQFHAKTGLTTSLIRQAVAAQPHYDAYLISPTPELEGVYSNLWQQGATIYPELLKLATKVLGACDLPHRFDEIQPSSVFCSGLHVVATPRFWSRYGEFLDEINERAKSRVSQRQLRSLAQAVPDPLKLFAGATYWSAILERLMPTFLKTCKTPFKHTRIAVLPSERRMNTHLRKLREMKDVAHRTKSDWLAGCWVHYRNAYLLGALSREWCDAHLPSITPKEIAFY